MEIIACHVNADFDSIAAMVAANKVYPKAKMVFTGSQNRNVREFLLLHQDAIRFLDLKYLNKELVTRLIVVDTRIADRLGELEDTTYQKGIEIFTFDHHPPTSDDMPNTQDFSEPTGATTTMLVKILRDRRISISPFEATLFALGIHEDTGSLTYQTSTFEDAEALAFLMGNGASIKVIDRFLNQPLSEEQRELLDNFLKSISVKDINGIKIMLTSSNAKTYIDGASVVARKIADIENVDVVFCFISTEDRIYIIGRSSLDEVHVGDILTRFDGGGHAQAGSAVVKSRDLQKVKEELISELHKHIKTPLTAGDVMSRSVVTIGQDTSLKEASKIMDKYNYVGLPVLEKGQLVGMISKGDIDKAIRHDLHHAPVKGFMSFKVITISSSTNIDEIEKIFTESEVGRLPVVENGQIIGIVSRSDLLKSTYGFEYLIEPKMIGSTKRRFSREDVVHRIRTIFPMDIQVLLRDIGRIAEQNGYEVYLVGGIVRDLLMEHQNLDIDIVLEKDGIAFGKFLTEKLGGRLVAHKKFGTAVAILPGNLRIDIATARAESYEHPAALPRVEFTSIRKDLARRDFALNAMAIALNTHKFGNLLDFFGGQKDIQDGTIRVLHDLSFVEDPTRIFRAIRFEQRYDFVMDTYTEDLAKKAVQMDLVGHLTSVRIRDELVLILCEEKTWAAMKRLSELGIMKHLQPNAIRIDARLQSLFKSIKDSIPRLSYYYKQKHRRWIIYLIALLRKMNQKQLDEWCAQMRFKKTDTDLLKEGVLEAPNILRKLRLGLKVKNSQLYFMLHPLSQESIIYIYAKSSQRLVRQKIDYYLANLRSVKISMSGKDLVRMGFAPSPLFSKVLNEVFVARLDGQVRSKADELKLAQDILDKESK